MNLESGTADQLEVTSGQLRAARALLGWSRELAADRCGVGSATLARIERDELTPRNATLQGIVRTFQDHGIRFFRDDFGLGVAIAGSLAG